MGFFRKGTKSSSAGGPIFRRVSGRYSSLKGWFFKALVCYVSSMYSYLLWTNWKDEMATYATNEYHALKCESDPALMSCAEAKSYISRNNPHVNAFFKTIANGFNPCFNQSCLELLKRAQTGDIIHMSMNSSVIIIVLSFLFIVLLFINHIRIRMNTYHSNNKSSPSSRKNVQRNDNNNREDSDSEETVDSYDSPINLDNGSGFLFHEHSVSDSDDDGDDEGLTENNQLIQNNNRKSSEVSKRKKPELNMTRLATYSTKKQKLLQNASAISTKKQATSDKIILTRSYVARVLSLLGRLVIKRKPTGNESNNGIDIRHLVEVTRMNSSKKNGRDNKQTVDAVSDEFESSIINKKCLHDIDSSNIQFVNHEEHSDMDNSDGGDNNKQHEIEEYTLDQFMS